MDKTNPTISLNNIYAFTDPSARGEEKSTFHLFVVGKNNFGIFLHNGKKYFLDELQTPSSKIVYYTPSIETNLFGETVVSKNFHNSHISNKIADLLSIHAIKINGITPEAINAIRPISQKQNITFDDCRQFENLFACVQKREKNSKYKQSSLYDFCQ